MKFSPVTKLVIVTVFSLSALFYLAFTGIAETDIDSTNRWAWSDTSGWWDFYETNTVLVGTSTLHGYASSSVGELALNCDSTPGGNICGTSNFWVCNGDSDTTCYNDASGNLSGCAWNDTVGWVSFWCGNYDCQGGDICIESNYRVTIDANGLFNGYAWNDVEGWISFNCANDDPPGCGPSDYKVETSWRAGILTGYLQSSIIDTQEAGGVTLHSIIWQGTQPAGTSADFQVAVATSTAGPWTYTGPEGSTENYYGRECPTTGVSDPGAGPDKAICIDKTLTAGYRYLRYKVRLQSNEARSLTPVVEDVILNWSN